MGDHEMEHTRLGDTGLKISRLALGCMSYGDPTTEGAHRWALADDDAQPFFRQAIERRGRRLEKPYSNHGPSWY
jgi:aryl-alcohol dehydrogenase-like predicted oxidoreductase